MKKMKFIIVITIFFIIACSAARWHEKVIFENKTAKVSLESKKENGHFIKIYAHPATLNKNSLEVFLKSISFFEETGFFSGRKKAAVFDDDEIRNLATPIIDCLKKADSSQRIHFISYNRGADGFFSHLRKTEGLVFVKPSGKLNIAFYLVNHEIRPHVNGDPVEIEVQKNPLKTKNSQTPVFSDNPEVKNHEFKDGGKSPVWLVADIGKLKDEVVENKKKGLEKTEERYLSPLNKNEKNDSWNAKKDKLTHQLQYIKDLYTQGLIDKKDYEAKKKELLKQIH